MKKLVLLVPFLFLLTGCKEDEYFCLNGYTLDESTHMCTRVVYEDAKLNYICEGRNQTVEGTKCKITQTTQATPTKVCNPGFNLEGSLCVKDGTIVNYEKCGTSRTYSPATKECYDKISAITTYKCEEGEVEGTTCVKVSYREADTEYVCEDEKYTVKGDKCEYTITMKAKNTNED